MDKHVKRNELINSLLQEICSKVGTERANKLIETINIELRHSPQISDKLLYDVASQLLQLGGVVANGLGQAASKLQKTSSEMDNQRRLSIITSALCRIIDTSSTVKVIFETLQLVDLFWNKIEKQLKKECENLKQIEASYFDADYKVLSDKVIIDWNSNLLRLIQDKIANDTLCPIMQNCSKQFLIGTVAFIKMSYNHFKTNSIKQKYIKTKLDFEQSVTLLQDSGVDLSTISLILEVIQAEYNEKLLDLLQETTSPSLVAEIIREDIPAGIHCIQALTEIIGRPIEIKTIGGDGTMIMPPRFVPSNSSSFSYPVKLEFHVRSNGRWGHFSDPDAEVVAENHATFDCLFEVVNRKLCLSITRDDVASVIEKNPVICQRIRKGIHGHFIKKGAVGGNPMPFILRGLMYILRKYGVKLIYFLKPIINSIKKLPPSNANRGMLKNICKNKKTIPSRVLIVTGLIDMGQASSIQNRDDTCDSTETSSFENSVVVSDAQISIESEENMTPVEALNRSSDQEILSSKEIEYIMNNNSPEKNLHFFRDIPILYENSIKPTGCDELLQVSCIEQWISKAKNEENGVFKNSKYDTLNLFFELRMSTKYVNWKHVDGTGLVSIQGHSGSLFGERNGNKLTMQLTKGQHEFHKRRSESALDANGVQNVLVKAVNTHLKETLSGEQLLNMEIQSPVHTTNGHNLALFGDRVKHAKGLDREREKLVQVTMALIPGANLESYSPPDDIQNDPYIIKVKEQMKTCTTIEELGDLLKKPSPYD